MMFAAAVALVEGVLIVIFFVDPLAVAPKEDEQEVEPDKPLGSA